MNIGDKVKIRTGKRGNPPRGEVVGLLTDPDGTERVKVKRGELVQYYQPGDLTVIEVSDGKAA